MRDLNLLPKAHLHLHFTGSMRVATLERLAERQGMRLPEGLTDNRALHVPSDQRGWFRFQRAYDAARKVVRSEESMRTIVREAAEDDAAESSRRLEIQIDPTSYAPFLGGITPALEIVLDEAKAANAATGVEIAVIVAASRIRHPLEARTLARLAPATPGTGRATSSASGCRTTNAGERPRSGRRPSASPAKPGCPPSPTAASSWGPSTCARSSTTWLRRGSATACAAARTPISWAGSSTRA